MPPQPPDTTLAFSVHTAPDIDAGRRLYGLQGLDDEDTARAMQHLRMQRCANEHLPAHQRKITAIAVAGRIRGQFSVFCLDGDEPATIEDMYRRMAHPGTTMVSYGGNQDLQTLRCRALMHGLGGGEAKHIDLAAWLTGDCATSPPLTELMQLQGLSAPTESLAVAAAAERRAVQVYLLWLRFARWQNQIGQPALHDAEHGVRGALRDHKAAHWHEFLNGWQ